MSILTNKDGLPDYVHIEVDPGDMSDAMKKFVDMGKELAEARQKILEEMESSDEQDHISDEEYKKRIEHFSKYDNKNYMEPFE